MLTWETLDILGYGAGTPSTTLALMACENALCGPPYPYPQVPIYNAVIFCDLYGEPSWVYRQAAFTAASCDKAGDSLLHPGGRFVRRLSLELCGDILPASHSGRWERTARKGKCPANVPMTTKSKS